MPSALDVDLADGNAAPVVFLVGYVEGPDF
jgi:hypothetical protein